MKVIEHVKDGIVENNKPEGYPVEDEKVTKDEETNNSEVVSPEMKKLLIRQLAHEMKNHNLYKMYTLYFNKEGLFKLSKYYTSRAKEELVHYEWIQHYLIDCDVVLEDDFAIEANSNKTPNRVKPFEDTLDREIETTKMINEIVTLAEEEKDWKTFNFLQKELVPEQVEEEKISRQILNIVNIDTDWLSKQDIIVELYAR